MNFNVTSRVPIHEIDSTNLDTQVTVSVERHNYISKVDDNIMLFQKSGNGHEIDDPLYYKDEWLGIPPDDYAGNAFPNGKESNSFRNAFPKEYERISWHHLGNTAPFQTAPLVEKD